VRGEIKGVVAEKDALLVNLKKMQTHLLVFEKEIVRLEGT
jgi:hypothetical protein